MPSTKKQYGVRPTRAISAKLEEVTCGGRKENYNLYITKVLAEHFNLPYWEVDDITPVLPNQQELPMSA